MERIKYNASNVFGDFNSPEEMVAHMCAIFGGEDGFFACWGRLLDFESMSKRVKMEIDACVFAERLQNVLGSFA